jgi:hypothetical protein
MTNITVTDFLDSPLVHRFRPSLAGSGKDGKERCGGKWEVLPFLLPRCLLILFGWRSK